jgi:hypothetical protein
MLMLGGGCRVPSRRALRLVMPTRRVCLRRALGCRVPSRRALRLVMPTRRVCLRRALL